MFLYRSISNVHILFKVMSPKKGIACISRRYFFATKSLPPSSSSFTIYIGEDAEPFEAQLIIQNESQEWVLRPIAESSYNQVINLTKQGFRQSLRCFSNATTQLSLRNFICIYTNIAKQNIGSQYLLNQ